MAAATRTGEVWVKAECREQGRIALRMGGIAHLGIEVQDLGSSDAQEHASQTYSAPHLYIEGIVSFHCFFRSY